MRFQILVNHIGYELRGSKRFVVQSGQELALDRFQVIDAGGGLALEGRLERCGPVPGWKSGFYHRGDFSALDRPGSYRLQVGELRSEPFAVRERVLPEACLADVLYYFKIQRCSGAFDRADHALPFFGEPQRPRADVHGGWYDASGDVSKYLSHLSEANYMNPQQSPLAVWSFLHAMELLRGRSPRLRALIPMLREEALYGADFLVRMQDPSGYFYASVMDGCTHDPAQRELCGYKGLSHAKHNEIQAAFREGGGMAIAALARISTLNLSGDYPPGRYLAAAETGFAHLLAHNLEYCDDHRENILDDYCALLAATELYRATQREGYRRAARERARSLAARIDRDERYAGWWRADEDGARPFFHVTDAGLPVVALLRYAEVEDEPSAREAAAGAALESLRFEMAITAEVTNPFGYARQYVKDLGGAKRAAFFFPHRNETGYWWQGENSRLGSLAAAALLASRLAPPERAARLKAYAADQMNWVLGLNPLDMCMLQGKGRNNPADYEVGLPGPPGGICNGFTSGVEDEQDIAFQPEPYGSRADWSWRWKEQWLMHAIWFSLALASLAAASDAPHAEGAPGA